MIDSMLALYTKDRLSRLLLLGCALFFCFSYALVNGVILERPPGRVTVEVVVLAVALGIGLPLGYGLTKRSSISEESRDSRLQFSSSVPFASASGNFSFTRRDRQSLDYSAMRGSLRELDIRRHLLEDEVNKLRTQFSTEYEKHYTDERSKIEPHLIFPEYRIGHALSMGAWAAVLLSSFVLGILAQAYFTVPAWTAWPLGAALSTAEFYVFRGAISILSGQGRLLSRITAAAIGVAALAMSTLIVSRVLSPSQFAVVAPVVGPSFALLAIVLPIAGGALAVSSERYLWSERFTSALAAKENQAARMEGEIEQLKALLRSRVGEEEAIGGSAT